MTPSERQRRVQFLFEEVIDLPPSERSQFLKEACGDDVALLREVERLIASSEEALTEEVLPSLATPLDTEPGLVDQRIGPYTLLQKLGDGGMGLVYLAERRDAHFQKQVALKIIRRGMDTDAIQQRFLAERQILANLEHPNIAHLLDGGVTEDGRPYFVLEYVDGVPINSYCDEQQLTIAERVDLFRDVCAAVSYAHRNLVIHRDLKPSNVLVTSEGTVKLLDFGIAKVVTPDENAEEYALTRTGERWLTPEYASPEQVRGGPITTSTDVYLLGVVLYELLTGSRPYQLTSRLQTDIERIICEEMPTRPSSVVAKTGSKERDDMAEAISLARQTRPDGLPRLLAGDLDTIVLMALRKEPERRYSSVEQLSEDLRRYREGLPVLARPDTFSYRSTKFFQRHKGSIVAAGLIFLSLVVGLSVALWQRQEARQQRDLAMQAATSMIQELAEGLTEMTGPTENRLGLLTQATTIFEGISATGLSTRDQSFQMVDAQRKLSQTYRVLGETETALKHATASQRRVRLLIQSGSASLQDRILLLSALVEYGDALAVNAQSDSALSVLNEALALAPSLLREAEAFPNAHRWYYTALSRKGDLIYHRALDSAAVLYERAFEVSDTLFKADPAEFSGLHATGAERLAYVLYDKDEGTQSCARYREALTVRQGAAAFSSANPEYLRNLSISFQNVGWCASSEGAYEEALRLYGKGTTLQRRLLNNDPSNTLYGSNLIGGLGQAAQLQVALGQVDEGLQRYKEALEVGIHFQDRATQDPSVLSQAATIAQMYANTLIQQGRYETASEAFRQTVALLEEARRLAPDDVANQRTLVETWTTEGNLLRTQGKASEAVARYHQALSLRLDIAASTQATLDRQNVAHAHYKLAMGLRDLAQHEAARQELLTARQVILDMQSELDESAPALNIYLPAIEEALAQR